MLRGFAGGGRGACHLSSFLAAAPVFAFAARQSWALNALTTREEARRMRKLTLIGVALVALTVVGTAHAGGWRAAVQFTNQIASSPPAGRGRPGPPRPTGPPA